MKTTSSVCGLISLHFDGLLTSLRKENLTSETLKHLPMTTYTYIHIFEMEQR